MYFAIFTFKIEFFYDRDKIYSNVYSPIIVTKKKYSPIIIIFKIKNKKIRDCYFFPYK